MPCNHWFYCLNSNIRRKGNQVIYTGVWPWHFDVKFVCHSHVIILFYISCTVVFFRILSKNRQSFLKTLLVSSLIKLSLLEWSVDWMMLSKIARQKPQSQNTVKFVNDFVRFVFVCTLFLGWAFHWNHSCVITYRHIRCSVWYLWCIHEHVMY